MNDETYRVRMTGISKRYQTIQTLDDVSLTLKPGKFSARSVTTAPANRP